MRRIELSVPTPCREDWANMEKNASGRFCGMCSKTVVDFTSMSDTEIASFINKNNTEICGRFLNDQLNRKIIIPRKPIPGIKYLLQVIFPAFLLSCKAGSQKVLSNKGTVIYESIIMGKSVAIPELDTTNLKVIKGRVLDESGSAIPGATVKNLLSHCITITDPEGYFDMKLTESLNELISVSAIGFETSETKIKDRTTLKLTMQTVTLGEVATTFSRKRKKIKIHSSEKKLKHTIEHALKAPLIYEGIKDKNIKAETITCNTDKLYSNIRLGGLLSIDHENKYTAPIPLLKHLYDTLFTRVIVYPNPVANGETLSISLTKSGAYKISLIDISGVVIKETRVSTYDDNSTIYFTLGQLKTAAYLIRLSNENTGKTITKKIIVH